jgi:hypothetical protein
MLHQPVVSSFLCVKMLVYDKASKRVAGCEHFFLLGKMGCSLRTLILLGNGLRIANTFLVTVANTFLRDYLWNVKRSENFEVRAVSKISCGNDLNLFEVD